MCFVDELLKEYYPDFLRQERFTLIYSLKLVMEKKLQYKEISYTP